MRNRGKALRLLADMKRQSHPNGLIELKLIGDIGTDIVASRVVRALRARPKADVRVTIDSHGGTVSVAREIYAALRAHRGAVAAHVSGRCLSAATLILLAADRRTATPASSFLLHPASQRPPASARWTAEKHRTRARELATLDHEIAEIIAARTRQPMAWVKTEMATEDTMTAQEAKARNLVQTLVAAPKPKARAVCGVALGIAPGHAMDRALHAMFAPRRVQGQEIMRIREQLGGGGSDEPRRRRPAVKGLTRHVSHRSSQGRPATSAGA